MFLNGLENLFKIGSFPQTLSLYNIFQSVLDVDNLVIGVFIFYHSENCYAKFINLYQSLTVVYFVINVFEKVSKHIKFFFL